MKRSGKSKLDNILLSVTFFFRKINSFELTDCRFNENREPSYWREISLFVIEVDIDEISV